MYYFIPNWDKNATLLDFDVIINQIKNFQKNKMPLQLLTDKFLPMLEYQLNSQGLLGIDVWQALDEIQDVHFKIGSPLTIDDIPKMNSLERVYYSSGISSYNNEQLFAKIKLFDNQIMSEIEYYKDEKIIHQDYFDNRGFLSRRVWFENDDKLKTILFNPFGEKVLTIKHKKQDEVEFTKKYLDKFKTYNGNNFNNLVNGVIERYLLRNKEQQNYLLMTFSNHGSNLDYKFDFNFKSCSFLLNDHRLDYSKFIKYYGTTMVPNEKRLQAILRNSPKQRVKMLSPYVTSLDLGKSNNDEQQNIFWKVNRISTNEFYDFAFKLIDKVIKEDDWTLTIDFSNGNRRKMADDIVRDRIEKIFTIEMDSAEFKLAAEYLKQKKEQTLLDTVAKKVEMQEKKPKWKSFILAAEAASKFEFEMNDSAEYYAHKLAHARILIDVDDDPNNYLQIKAISAGIPQINKLKTRFVTNYKNGFSIEKNSQFLESIEYFLNNLNNWNISLINNLEKISEFSGENAIKIINKALNRG